MNGIDNYYQQSDKLIAFTVVPCIFSDLQSIY